jgi:hypothetical protein
MKPIRYLSALLLVVSAPAFSGHAQTKDEAIALAAGAIHEFGLTTLKDECGAIAVIEKPSYFEITVRERHIPSCGGTPETAPRLFNVRVRKKDGQLTSDVYDGTSYKLLDHKLDVHDGGQPKR